MKVLALSIAALMGLGLLAVDKAGIAAAGVDRTDCPGKIVCPQTGELVCRDRCPTVDPDRADCPGRIICPETGKRVCIDRCPLHDSAETPPASDGKPSCCQP